MLAEGVVASGGGARCRIVGGAEEGGRRDGKKGMADPDELSGRERARKKRSAGLLNGVRDKKQIRFTHSRFPLANSISFGVPLTLCL